MLNSVPFCYWKGAKFMEKIDLFGQFWHASSTHCPNLNLLCAGGRAESVLLLSFLCKVLRHKDTLPFPREKIDSGVLWHNFGIFTHTKIWVFFFFVLFFCFFVFFFFLNKVNYKSKLQLAYTGVCTKLKENTYNTQCTIFQFNNRHIPEYVQS